MRLSAKGRYAVNAMVELAVNYRRRPLSVKAISRKNNVSTGYLEQLLYRLGKSGLIGSVRGPGGGFFLRKEPGKVSILEIIEAIEEPVLPVHCGDGRERRRGADTCARIGSCASRLLWRRLRDRIREVLRETTLEDLRQEAAKKTGAEVPENGYVFTI